MILVLASIKSYTQDPVFLQSDLYKEFNIQSIITYSDCKTGDCLSSIFHVNKKNYIWKADQYCDSDKLFDQAFYNDHGQLIKRISYGYDCDEKKASETIYLYLEDQLQMVVRTNNFVHYEILESFEYYKNGAEKAYYTYSFNQKNWYEEYEYDTLNRSGIERRIARNGDTIHVTKVFYDDEMRKVKREHRYDHKLTSVYTYEYDQFGNLKREAGVFYPQEELKVERFWYYSDSTRLDSSTHLSNFFNKGVEPNRTLYVYNDNGLLLQRTFYDNVNDKVNTTRYAYKSRDVDK